MSSEDGRNREGICVVHFFLIGGEMWQQFGTKHVEVCFT